MRKRTLVPSLVVPFVSMIVACQGETVPLGGAPPHVGGGAAQPSVAPVGTLTQADKVDLLLMVDNSSSMTDKQQRLLRAVPALVGRLVAPNCVDTAGAVVGQSKDGACTTGSLEFAPVKDLHVGVLTSSLGGQGGDVCRSGPSREDDRAHLVTRGPGGAAVADAAGGFLRFGAGGITDATRLQDGVRQLIDGVGEGGCGLEAQLESWYRFLVEPMPYESIGLDTAGRAELRGIDATILEQRRAFLRPDSLVSLVILTDEDDSAPDPRAIGGAGWAFVSSTFPGSTVARAGFGTTAPRATSACAADPLASACTSCAFAAASGDPVCAQGAYYGPDEDALNTRFFQMKRRFGVDPQYPLARYVQGLLGGRVPDSDLDHDEAGVYVGGTQCTNPLYAAALPASASDELCNLPAGPRSSALVVVNVIAGAPPAMLHPGMTDADWTKVVGRDPTRYDFTGIDLHMVQSLAPRAGLPGVDAAIDADPVHGREWDTQKSDLQYACSFPLETPRDCDSALGSCDCRAGAPSSPLCDPANPTSQLRAKAYPSIRPLQLARMLGGNAVASSICEGAPVPAPSESGAIAPSPSYAGAMQALGDRMARSLVPARD